MGTLISARELKVALASDTPPIVLDIRWQPKILSDKSLYLAGHVPGAIFVDLESELSAPGTRELGGHPLPDLETLQANVRRWGIQPGQTVVLYDDRANVAAARGWWLLTWAGISARLLDGGYQAWVQAGYPSSSGDELAETAGTVLLKSGQLPVTPIDEVVQAGQGGVLIDARTLDRYLGLPNPIDKNPGHIPGAVSVPTDQNLSLDGRFLTAAEIASRYAQAGVKADIKVTVYCGSGVSAAHSIAALVSAGFPAPSLYVGSWSQWSSLRPGDIERAAAPEESTHNV